MISIIIPVLDEEEILRRNFAHFEKLRDHAEIIFIDGGSHDKTCRVASRLGRVISSKRGRARQMNCGAKEAKEATLLFLHADCSIDKDAIDSAGKCLEQGAMGGCFTQRLTNDKRIYRFIEGVGNRRARREKIFYGDQGIFVRKDVFFSLGGFPDAPVMEDVLFSSSLKKIGKVEVLDNPIYVSTRRWEKNGFFKTNLSYLLMVILFKLRIPLSFIRNIFKDVR